jgi:hypothetical protein
MNMLIGHICSIIRTTSLKNLSNTAASRLKYPELYIIPPRMMCMFLEAGILYPFRLPKSRGQMEGLINEEMGQSLHLTPLYHPFTLDISSPAAKCQL